MISKIEDDTKNSQSNINKINDINDKEKESILKTRIMIKFELLNKEYNLNMTLSDLKKYINTKFNIKEYEYKLFLDENSINDLSKDISIQSLLNKYNSNNIYIKTFKNILDVNKELNNYEKLLSKKISVKEEEIKLLNTEIEKLTEDLTNIK